MLFLPTKQAEFFLSLITQSISKTMNKNILLYIAGRSLNWYNLNGGKFGNIKITEACILSCSSSAFGKIHECAKLCVQNYKVPYCSLVYENTRLTTTQMVINKEWVP